MGAAIVSICKYWSFVSLGSHLIASPALLVVAGLSVTPVGVGVGSVSAACFLYKHPGKSVTAAQWSEWDAIYRNAGLR